MAVAVLGARCGWALRLAGLAAWAAMTCAAAADESAFVLAFVHLHNATALALWWALRPRDRRALAVVALVVAGVALLLVGALDPVVAAAGGWQVPLAIPGLDSNAQAYAPGAEVPWAMRVVLSFAFLQAVHYAVWLRLVPEDARPRPAPRPFRASWRALRDDLGRPLLGLALLLALGIAAWGALDLIAAREATCGWRHSTAISNWRWPRCWCWSAGDRERRARAMMVPPALADWLLAFAITQLVEAPIYRRPSRWPVALAASALTHPWSGSPFLRCWKPESVTGRWCWQPSFLRSALKRCGCAMPRCASGALEHRRHAASLCTGLACASASAGRDAPCQARGQAYFLKTRSWAACGWLRQSVTW
jgi:hypothetical protein